jgi:hypothetical protein
VVFQVKKQRTRHHVENLKASPDLSILQKHLKLTKYSPFQYRQLVQFSRGRVHQDDDFSVPSSGLADTPQPRGF